VQEVVPQVGLLLVVVWVVLLAKSILQETRDAGSRCMLPTDCCWHLSPAASDGLDTPQQILLLGFPAAALAGKRSIAKRFSIMLVAAVTAMWAC